METAEVNPGRGLEGTSTATEALEDDKGEGSSEELSNHNPKSLLVMGMETLLLTGKSKRSSKKSKKAKVKSMQNLFFWPDLSKHFTH